MYEVEKIEDENNYLIKMPKTHYVLTFAELIELKDNLTIAINQELDDK